jgi:hypothetical protein
MKLNWRFENVTPTESPPFPIPKVQNGTG